MNLKQLNTIIVLPLMVLIIFAIITFNWVLLGAVLLIYVVYAIWYEGKRK